MGTVDDFLASLPDDRAETMRRVVRLARDEVADAAQDLKQDPAQDLARDPARELAQGTTYAMPALFVDGKPLLAMASARAHLAVYPCSGRAVAAVSDRLADGRWSKGTVRFTVADPLPEDVVRDLVRARLREIRG